jgi:hypothetical protein
MTDRLKLGQIAMRPFVPDTPLACLNKIVYSRRQSLPIISFYPNRAKLHRARFGLASDPEDPADDLSSDPRSASGADPVVDRPVRLRLPRPLPALRRLVRQPGFVAGGAVTLVVAVRLAGFLKNGVSKRGQIPVSV